MQVSLEEAYNEACTALGDSIVKERLMTKFIAQNGLDLDTQQNQEFVPGSPPITPGPDAPRTEAVESGGQVPDSPADGIRNSSGNGHGDISGGTDETKLTAVKGDANADGGVKQREHQKN